MTVTQVQRLRRKIATQQERGKPVKQRLVAQLDAALAAGKTARRGQPETALTAKEFLARARRGR